MDQLTFWSEEPLASRSALPDCEKDWTTLVATYALPISELLTNLSLDGSSGKMSLESCQATEEGILVPSSGRWKNAGTGGATESWTLSGSEWPSAVDVCSLSETLEAGSVPQRYYLSARACAGILRRAEKRGKELPKPLLMALESVAKNV